jgi:hypothetical protein
LGDWFGLSTGVPPKDGTPVVGDPLFVSTTVGAEDLRIQPGSPAIDAGTAPASPVTNDFFFNQRTNTIDIGAHEGR